MNRHGARDHLGLAGWLVALCWYGVAAWVVLEYLAALAAPAWNASGEGLAGWATRAQCLLGLLVLAAAFILVHLGWRAASRGVGAPPGGTATPPRATAFPSPPTLLVGTGILSFALLSLAAVVAIMRLQPTSDTRMALLMTCAAGVGSSIATILGFLEHASQKKDFDPAYAAWYVGRPLIGLLLGLLFFFIVKGGILVVLPTLSRADVKLDPYGLAAIGGMVGLFSKHATEKLHELFDVLFETKSQIKGQVQDEILAQLPPELQAQVRAVVAPTPTRDGEAT
jgi:hypothetical protein